MVTTNEPATNAREGAGQKGAEHKLEGSYLSRRSAARYAGVGYLLLFLLGIFANFIVREGLVVPGDASATAANIVASENMFRVGLYGFLVIFLLDVALAWLLFVLFRNVNRDVAQVAAWFRLVYTVFLGAAYLLDTTALTLLENYTEYSHVFLIIVAIPAIIGELAFTLWLLFRAGKEQEQRTSVDSQLHSATKSNLAIS